MFFASVGLLLVLAALVAARRARVQVMTLGWRLALYGALAVFFLGLFADAYAAPALHWDGLRGLLLSAAGDLVMWGGVSLLVVWFAVRAAFRLRRDGGNPFFSAGSRLDLLVVVLAGLVLAQAIPRALDAAEATREGFAAPRAERVTFETVRAYEADGGGWFSRRREAVFRRANGAALVIPLPVSERLDGWGLLREVTRAGATGAVFTLTYYPRGQTVVSLRPL